MLIHRLRYMDIFQGAHILILIHLSNKLEDMENIGDDTVGLQRRDDKHKPKNPSPPRWPGNPGEECPDDDAAIKSYKFYQYDAMNRMSASNEDGVVTNYTYDTMGNLIREQSNCKITDYRYNKLNQLIRKTANGRSYSYSYDARGNRTAEYSICDSQTYYYDETNQMTQGTNWEGTTSYYVYNGLGKRVANTVDAGVLLLFGVIVNQLYAKRTPALKLQSRSFQIGRLM